MMIKEYKPNEMSHMLNLTKNQFKKNIHNQIKWIPNEIGCLGIYTDYYNSTTVQPIHDFKNFSIN